MSTRSDVGFACKAELVKQIDALFPWVRNDADDVREHEEGMLFLFYDYKWNNIDGGDVQSLYSWLNAQNSDDYIIQEGCHDYPSMESECDVGGWVSNPWNVRKVVQVSIQFNDLAL